MYPVSNVVPAPDVGPEPPGLVSRAMQIFGFGPKPGSEPPKDPYTDDKELLKTFAKEAKRCSERRVAFERVWWRLLLYLLGRQWIYLERGSGQWVDKRLQKWIPRPVTNKIAEGLNTILSVFQSVTLGVSCRPEGNDPKDIQAADTANKYEAPLREDHDMVRVQDESDFWMTALGNAWWFTWWDYSGDTNARFVPYEQCVACQQTYSPVDVKKAGDKCPGCGNQVMQAAVNPETGEKIGAHVRSGHGRTDVCSPLEVSFPLVFSNPDDSDVIIRTRWRTKEYYADRLDAATLARVKWDNSASERSLQMLRSLAAATDLTASATGLGGGEPGESNLGTTEKELWKKPCKQYPNGLVLRVIDATEDGDGIIVKLPGEGLPGPLPFLTEDGRRIWPWIHIGYEKFGGRGLARSPLEHVLQKQDQLNQLDSMTQLIVQRVSNPVWLEPKGAEVTKFTGEPGLVIKYNPLAGGGNSKPERVEGANIPSGLVRLREVLIQDIESLLGTQDILKGNKPAGVEAFSAMQLLVERSQSRYGKVLEARGVAYRRWFKIALDMERKFGPEERAIAILGPNGSYTRHAFKKAQLDGSVRIEVEDGSQMPKTALGTRAAIQQLQTLGVIDTQNAETRYAILQKFGQVGLYPGLDAQVMGARRVQDEFERWASTVTFAPPQPVVGPAGAMAVDPATAQPMMAPPAPMAPPPGIPIKPWMNSDIYLGEHMKWASGDAMQRIMAERPEIEPYVSMLIMQHQQAVAMAQAAQQQAANPNGKDGKGVGAGRAMTNSNQESGKPGANAGPANAA